jgi:hypothetical protein
MYQSRSWYACSSHSNARSALARNRAPATSKALTKFVDQVNALERKRRLSATNASALRERAQRVMEDPE